MYPLCPHLRVILWKRNRDLKCNNLVLFLAEFWALHILFTFTLGWSFEWEMGISSVIVIFWSFEAYCQATSILFTCTFGGHVKKKVDLKCKCLSILQFWNIFRIFHWFSNHQFGTLNSTFKKKTLCNWKIKIESQSYI